ncbi:nucleoside triphosphate pyrophosphohydrolase [Gammaproteobacteria bacterium]|nr:nucleoside triphosphate pyrophosphohydrolase [Gammaproteobacteria bacterium]MDB2445365.1 nucleoside triphosphate pyrophosphohydrolase [Gammaproteobacteria bacterium]
MSDLIQKNEGLDSSNLKKLLKVVAMLRHPEFGCPWDLKQSIKSLVPHTLEEVYEVVDAIDKNDMAGLEDELGDLLFQIVFYAQLASEEVVFNFDDVAKGVVRKLVRRHPHVFPGGEITNFGEQQKISSDQVVANWESIKEQERQEKREKMNKNVSGDRLRESVLSDVPTAVPAFERARKMQKKAASVGFDWSSPKFVLAKLREELEELEEIYGNGVEVDEARVKEELGDVLFTCVNFARHLKISSESALREANHKFDSRFRFMENELQELSIKFKDASSSDLEALWNKAKQSRP